MKISSIKKYIEFQWEGFWNKKPIAQPNIEIMIIILSEELVQFHK
jgi:hypothetical protein